MAGISKKVVDGIRKDYLSGDTTSARALAIKLECDKTTVLNYRKIFNAIANYYPDRISDYSFNLKVYKVNAGDFTLDRERELKNLFFEIVDAYHTNYGFQPKPLYEIYKSKVKWAYSYRIFTLRFWTWKRENNICYYHHLRIKEISSADLYILKRWRKFTGDARKFKIAFAIIASYEGIHLKQIAKIVDKTVGLVIEWFNNYRKFGIPEIGPKTFNLSEASKRKIKTKQDNLIKLVHQSPALFNINRSSWRIKDLATLYEKEYGQSISPTSVSENLALRQIGFKKSRESLTSNDPKFREKLDYIKLILSNLTPDEKFFSIDEYGHFAVKIKGGRSLIEKSKVKIIPQIQDSKGFMVVVAALELSKNQVTHFYSKHKNTVEMIKLIDLLCVQYAGNKTLYLSWDAAVWHRSKLLRDHLNRINDVSYRNLHNTPIVKLAPLPSSSQFLNVIESVFSGLARAVIHNSSYSSVDECQYAIDTHFANRNKFFIENPKKAGKMIWGKELVKPVFDEANNCDIKK